MTILNEICAVELAPALERLRKSDLISKATSEVETSSLSRSNGRALETFLRAIATLETGLELGLSNPLDEGALESARVVLIQDAVKKYCLDNSLVLPDIFLRRFDNGSKHLIDDGAKKAALDSIDYAQYQCLITDAFTDVVKLGRSLSANYFLRASRLGVYIELLAEARDEEVVRAVGGIIGNEVTLAPPGDAWLSTMVNALPEFERAIAELSIAETSIKQFSVHSDAAHDLIADHFLPDALRLSKSLRVASEKVCSALYVFLAPRAKQKTLRSIVSGQFDLGYEQSPDVDAQSHFAPIEALRDDGIAEDAWIITNIMKTSFQTQSALARYARHTRQVVSLEDGVDSVQADNHLLDSRILNLL